MGFGRSRNPLGPDGTRLKCHECESEEHLVKDCPRRRGQPGRALFANAYATSSYSSPFDSLGQAGPPAPDDQAPLFGGLRVWMIREGRGRGRTPLRQDPGAGREGRGNAHAAPAPAGGGAADAAPQVPAQDPMQAADPWVGGQPSPDMAARSRAGADGPGRNPPPEGAQLPQRPATPGSDGSWQSVGATSASAA